MPHPAPLIGLSVFGLNVCLWGLGAYSASSVIVGEVLQLSAHLSCNHRTLRPTHRFVSQRFKMHDTNEDGFWDLKEIEAMMWDEASKLHEAIAKSKNQMDGEIDKYAVKEEMARMRDHLVGTMDADGDMMVSSEEFLTASGKKDFKDDKAWKPVNPEKEVGDEKLAEFDKHRKAIKKSKHKNLPPDMIDIAQKKMAERELIVPPRVTLARRTLDLLPCVCRQPLSHA